MKARDTSVKVSLNAKVVDPRFGQNIDKRLVLIGHAWTGTQDFCVHGKKLRWHCDWCATHFHCS